MSKALILVLQNCLVLCHFCFSLQLEVCCFFIFFTILGDILFDSIFSIRNEETFGIHLSLADSNAILLFLNVGIFLSFLHFVFKH